MLRFSRTTRFARESAWSASDRDFLRKPKLMVVRDDDLGACDQLPLLLGHEIERAIDALGIA